jgi:transposase
MNIKLIGIDLAKNVFQLCAVNRAGKVLFNRSVKRARLHATMAQFEPTRVAMEACSGAHYWGRAFEQLGHEVTLIPPQHVKPFVRSGKSDAHDALAICEAAGRPNLHPVPIKSIAQQDLQSLHRLRQHHVDQSTALANQIRSVGREYGLIFPKGIRSLMTQLPQALEDGSNTLSMVARGALYDHYLQLHASREAAAKWKREIIQLANQLPAYHDLQVVPGFGPVNTSAYLAAIGDGSQFKCGRQVSAWLGLTPGQYGTGGKLTLLGITKQGDRYARKMLIHGARAAICRHRRNCPPLANWVDPIIARRGFNKAVVALANKLARIGWVIVRTGAEFDLQQAFKPAR